MPLYLSSRHLPSQMFGVIWTITLKGRSTVISGIPEPPTSTSQHQSHPYFCNLHYLHVAPTVHVFALNLSHLTQQFPTSPSIATAEVSTDRMCCVCVCVCVSGRQKWRLFTRFVVHEKDNIRPLSDHSKEFHHTRRSEGTPRTHLLTAESLQGDLWE